MYAAMIAVLALGQAPGNAALDGAVSMTLTGLGACQGVSLIGGKLYLYGDLYTATPRVGVLREYGPDLRPTGRSAELTRGGKPLIIHPTGLTSDPEFGTYLGDTVNQKAVIYRIDLGNALDDGHLDRAVEHAVRDDAAVNGCRPLFVTLRGKRYLATADYGDRSPEVRLLDPAKLAAADRTSAPGVVVHRFRAGPFNQNLAWDEAAGHLICVQNVTAGVGWRLDVIDLAKAVDVGSADPARVASYTLPYKTELEGYCRLPDGRELFVTAHGTDNIWLGRVRP